MKRIIFAILTSIFSLNSNAWVINADFENGTIGQKATGNGFEAFKTTLVSSEHAHTGKLSAKATITGGTSGWPDFGGMFKYPANLARDRKFGFGFGCTFPQGLI